MSLTGPALMGGALSYKSWSEVTSGELAKSQDWLSGEHLADRPAESEVAMGPFQLPASSTQGTLVAPSLPTTNTSGCCHAVLR
jgi:hypothetical protein